MDRNRKQKLMDLDLERLVDELLELAVYSDDADDLVERLIASPEGNIQRFKKKLSNLIHADKYIDWRGSAAFARKLNMVLLDLKAGVTDPVIGLQHMIAFYEADCSILGMCDDSSGHIETIYTYEAKELFVNYASRCDNKNMIADAILELMSKDEFGVRRSLIESAGEFLPESVIHSMITTIQNWSEKENRDYGSRHQCMFIESLARQIKDAKLFEKTRIASCGTPSTTAFIDIARVYLESGDHDTAYAWLEKIPQGDTYDSYERDKLLEAIYTKRGDSSKLADLLTQKFRAYHSLHTLGALLDVIGIDKRDEVIAEEVVTIQSNVEFSARDMEFFIEIGKIDEAEDYCIVRADQLNGDFYGSLLPLAEAMESEKRNLAAILIYRSLLLSILDRGYAKAYPHGITYLKKLDSLSPAITDWRNFIDHDTFKARIIGLHRRKRSFWDTYKLKK